jgi:hypothetical protein
VNQIVYCPFVFDLPSKRSPRSEEGPVTFCPPIPRRRDTQMPRHANAATCKYRDVRMPRHANSATKSERSQRPRSIGEITATCVRKSSKMPFAESSAASMSPAGLCRSQIGWAGWLACPKELPLAAANNPMVEGCDGRNVVTQRMDEVLLGQKRHDRKMIAGEDDDRVVHLRKRCAMSSRGGGSQRKTHRKVQWGKTQTHAQTKN